MTYDDDELAEAALFLTQHDRTRSMPAALDEKLRSRAEAFASEVRFTTTKAASLALETDPEPALARPSTTRAWLGWLAAAACVALAVYGWRVNVVERQAAARRAATTEALEASEAIRWSRGAHSGEITVGALPPNALGEHYRVWLSSSSVAQARPAGSFVCREACRGRIFRTTDPTELDAVTSVWITQNAESDAWDSVGRGKVVTEGHGGTP